MPSWRTLQVYPRPPPSPPVMPPDIYLGTSSMLQCVTPLHVDSVDESTLRTYSKPPRLHNKSTRSSLHHCCLLRTAVLSKRCVRVHNIEVEGKACHRKHLAPLLLSEAFARHGHLHTS